MRENPRERERGKEGRRERNKTDTEKTDRKREIEIRQIQRKTDIEIDKYNTYPCLRTNIPSDSFDGHLLVNPQRLSSI